MPAITRLLAPTRHLRRTAVSTRRYVAIGVIVLLDAACSAGAADVMSHRAGDDGASDANASSSGDAVAAHPAAAKTAKPNAKASAKGGAATPATGGSASDPTTGAQGSDSVTPAAETPAAGATTSSNSPPAAEAASQLGWDGTTLVGTASLVIVPTE